MAMLLHLCLAYDCFHHTTSELNICNRDNMATKPKLAGEKVSLCLLSRIWYLKWTLSGAQL
jgi:hypothetical protein